MNTNVHMAANGRAAGDSAQRHRDIVVTLPRQRVLPALLRRVEVCGVVVFLLVLTNGILPLLVNGSSDVDRSDSAMLVVRMIYWCFYAFTAAQVVLRPRDFVRCAAKVPFPIAMVLLALLSASWSLDPSETLRRTFALGMATLFGIYLALRFCPRDLLRLVAGVLGTCAVLSVAFGLLLPSYGIAHGVYDGDWQGVFTHKNTLGGMMLLTAVIFRSVPGRSGRSRLVGWIGVGLAVILVVLSQSMTALVVLGAVGLTMPLLRRFRQRRLRSALLLVAACVLCTAALLMSTDRDVALTMMGKDVTLTGRTGIWSAVMDEIVKRPFLGYGYGAFWLRAPGPGESVRQVIQWATPHAHNGFLDIAADLGLLGVLTLIGALAHAGQRVWKRWRPELGTSDDWLLASLIVILLMDVTESLIYEDNYFAWALLVAVAAATTGGLVAAQSKGKHEGGVPSMIAQNTRTG
jgi:exopolysaccharide production protein ExoQ